MRVTQELRLQALFEAKEGEWVPLPEILALRPQIAQYGRAIHSLRHKERYGYMNIQNKTQMIEGVVCSWFGYNIQEKQLEFSEVKSA